MPILGCVADDFTGATDVAGVLVSDGMRTLVVLDIHVDIGTENYDAIVVALKSRTAPVNVAVDSSLAALRWLLERGCSKFYFKYCSTFDSRPTGNIGPVIDAFMAELTMPLAIVCPAFPANGRTVYQNYLFVKEQLVSESSMRNHPLTPITDANLVRLLKPQTNRTIGSIFLATVLSGVTATREALQTLQVNGVEIVVADAISEDDLHTLASAGLDQALMTGASGIATGIPAALRGLGLLQSKLAPPTLPKVKGSGAIISGSCSAATLEQVRHVRDLMPVFDVNALSVAHGETSVEEIMAWAKRYMDDGPFLVSATSDVEAVRRAQHELGVETAGSVVEELLASVSIALVDAGVRKLVVAGGETSGAVLQALNVRALQIGPQIDPGVHWAVGHGREPIALALKSGNFGAKDFFSKAWSYL